MIISSNIPKYNKVSSYSLFSVKQYLANIVDSIFWIIMFSIILDCKNITILVGVLIGVGDVVVIIIDSVNVFIITMIIILTHRLYSKH